MPILERDPWRLQFFDNVSCPDDVVIPTDDPDCWRLYPQFRWVYDKLKIAATQGLDAAPHGVAPPSYPVFSKPIINLRGMGIGSRVITSDEEFAHAYQPGHMWMPLLTGEHVSTDCAVVDGHLAWIRHATGVPWTEGMFRYWTVHAQPKPELLSALTEWIEIHMAGYTGMMNFETIGGTIIEAHLRFADQWCDLYGDGWVQALVGLYVRGVWSFDGAPRPDGYSIPLFATHGAAFRHPPLAEQEAIRRMSGVKSLQITFHETKAGEDHAMPPGGFRLGIVNCTSLDAGFAALDRLAACFPPELIQHQR